MGALLSGCSTTQSVTSVNDLQIKVTQLERKLDKKDQEVSELQLQVKELTNQVKGLEDVSLNEPIEEYVPQTKKSSQSMVGFKNKQIIRVSASSQDVQMALQRAGYYEGDIDGKIGRKSREAIVEFQKEHDLKADGIVGKQTWTALQHYLDE